MNDSRAVVLTVRGAELLDLLLAHWAKVLRTEPTINGTIEGALAEQAERLKLTRRGA